MTRINTGTATGTDQASSGYENVLSGDSDDSDSSDSGGSGDSDDSGVDEVTYSGGVNSSDDEDSYSTDGEFLDNLEEEREQSDLRESTIMVRVDAFAVDAGNIDGTIYVTDSEGSRSASVRKSSRYRRFQYYIEQPKSGHVVVETSQGQDKKQSYTLQPGDVERLSFDIEKDPGRTPNDPNDYLPQEDTDADEFIGDTTTDDAEQPTDGSDASASGGDPDPLYRTYDQYGGEDADDADWDDYEYDYENAEVADGSYDNDTANDTDTTTTTTGDGNWVSIGGILALIVAGLALAWRLLFG